MKNILLLVLVIALTFVSAYGDRDAQLASSEYDHHAEDQDAFAFLEVDEDMDLEAEEELENHVSEYAEEELQSTPVVAVNATATPVVATNATTPVVAANATTILHNQLTQYRDAALKLSIDVTGGVEQLKDGTFIAKGANNTVVTVYSTIANASNSAGCYNNAQVINGVCYCPSKFTGKYCGSLSFEATPRQFVQDINANITADIAKMQDRLVQFAASVKKPAVEDLIKRVVDKEAKRVIFDNTVRVFRQAVAINDIYNAKVQLGMIEGLSKTAYDKLTRELALHEDKLESSLVKPTIRQFVNPTYQTSKYEFIDTSKVPVVSGASIALTADILKAADTKRREFNMRYADSV